MCLAQELNAVTPVRLEPATPQSRVKHSTTEPLRFPNCFFMNSLVFVLNMLKVRAVGRRSMHWRCHCDAAEMLAIVLRASRRSAFFLDAVGCLVFVMLSRLSIAALWSLLSVRLEPTTPQSRVKHLNTGHCASSKVFFCMNSLV